MTEITLSATPKGNGYQATVSFPDGVSTSSAETYPTVAEAITAAALKLLDLPERLKALDQTERAPTATGLGSRPLQQRSFSPIAAPAREDGSSGEALPLRPSL
jgi:hypothetical protein